MSEPQIATKETFRAKLERLVANFAANEDELTSPGFPETECRTQFITPFFRALGWDVENLAGKPFREQEVLEERGPTSEGRPDYTFRIGGVPKFFVEAKAPHEDLDSERHVMQVKRYAWSTKEVFAVILTDFSEFRFYDASLQPDTAHAHRGLINNFRFNEYLDHLDDLWNFSRPRVAEGSIEALLPRDKQSLRFRKPPDDAFLEDMSRWRTELAGAVHKHNPHLNAEELTSVVQRLLDRLIFIRVAEDRRILEKNSLRDRAEEWMAIGRRKPLVSMLNALFHVINSDFNGEIFKEHASERIDLEGDITLYRIISELYPPKSPYRFDAIPVDIFGAVYERYLGKTIYVKGKKIEVDEKPAVRKAGGVYYTPKYIVNYIVKNTVGKLIEGKSPDEIEAVKILDPACGSGSFLLGAYQYLIDYHRDWYEKHPKKADTGPLIGDVSRDSNGNPRPSIWRKGKILSNNIFGVDLDLQAVEITMMNLYLKALEDERDLPRNKRVLPPLTDNIKCGNSLIAPDIAEQQPTLTPDELHRLRPFDWQKEFPGIMQSGGFHAVIGNPPYGADYSTKEKQYFQSRYTYRKGKPETYLFFLEQGIKLLNQRGALGFITPNAWLTNYYGIQIRRLVLNQCSIDEIVDLEPTRVFQKAVVDTAITILAKESRSNLKHRTRISQGTKDQRIVFRFESFQGDWGADSDLIFNVQASPLELRLLRKLEASGQTLNDLVDYSQGVIPYKTKEQGRANRYISSKRKTKDWLPLFESASQVRRYELDEPKAYISYGKWLWCPREGRYFSQAKILFHRLRKKLPVQLVSAIDESGAINRHSLSNLVLRPGNSPENLWFILGIFNSKLANWWFVKKYGLLMEVAGFKVGRMPLPSNWTGKKEKLITLVDQLLELIKSRRPNRDVQADLLRLNQKISRIDKKIDALVYELYGLTTEEIKLVEITVPRTD